MRTMYKHYRHGFALVELLISLAIIGMIINVVIFSYSAWNDELALSSAAQEMSIAIRQAQEYGLSVKERAVGGGDFSSGYGISFNTSDSRNYYVFSDNGTGSIGRYDGGASCASGGDCVIEKVTLQNNVQITSVCGTPFGVGAVSACPPSSGLVVLNATFLRPNTDASIRFTNSSYGSMSGLYQSGKVVLTSQKGRTVNVTIDSTGQITIQ